jgi:very-short-patch-repair endonuclease
MSWLGIAGFGGEAVHIVVPRGARALRVPGVEVVVHESRRFSAADILPRLPPTVGLERATIDAAVWSVDIRTATTVITAPIQQRRTTAVRLREELAAAGQVRFRRVLFPFLADLEGGAEALSEVAFLRWCRQHRLPKPILQVRTDHFGRRRYLDAVFSARDNRRVLVEIDGGVHLTLAARWKDTAKDNDAAIAGETTLRFPSVAIYADDPLVVRQIEAALRTCQQRASL